MKKNVAFTICATNYVGLGKVLEKSIYEHYCDLDFYIVVADEPMDEVRKEFDENVIIAKEVLGYPEQKWYEMAFKYNLTEFCTAIKPASILYLLEMGYEKCIYFDPDIFVFSSIEIIYKNLDHYYAIVTPHITEIERVFSGNVKEDRLLFSGTFNLGFFGIRKTPLSEMFLRWWSNRLENYCFANMAESLFTDQKWVDLLPSFFAEKLLICRDKGLNMAPWNFHEREIVQIDGKIYVCNRIHNNLPPVQLVFVHYSGYNYKNLLSGEVEQDNIKNMVEYEDLDVLFRLYRSALVEGEFSKFIDRKYMYNYFKNSKISITNTERILFRGYIEGTDYRENPFLESSYFYKRIKKLGFLEETNKPIKFEEVINGNGSKKIDIINKLFKLLFKIIGPGKYYNLTRAFFKYSIWENHYFLICKNEDIYKIRQY